MHSMSVHTSGAVVAVVDDDHGIRQSLAYLLESADYSVLLFASGTELIAGGAVAEIACLISDIDMPGLDGFELLRHVHAIRPNLPTVLITGYPDRLARLPEFLGVSPRVFIKPFQGHELLGAVRDAVSAGG
jgi:two-component system response regulator FixJ